MNSMKSISHDFSGAHRSIDEFAFVDDAAWMAIGTPGAKSPFLPEIRIAQERKQAVRDGCVQHLKCWNGGDRWIEPCMLWRVNINWMR